MVGMVGPDPYLLVTVREEDPDPVDCVDTASGDALLTVAHAPKDVGDEFLSRPTDVEE